MPCCYPAELLQFLEKRSTQIAFLVEMPIQVSRDQTILFRGDDRFSPTALDDLNEGV